MQSFSQDQKITVGEEFVEPLPRVWDTQLPRVIEHIHSSEKFDDEELVGACRVPLMSLVSFSICLSTSLYFAEQRRGVAPRNPAGQQRKTCINRQV